MELNLYFRRACCLLCFLFFSVIASADLQPLPTGWKQRVMQSIPGADSVTDQDAKTLISKVMKGGEVVGYSFETAQQVDIPAYSGKPVNLLVTFDSQGVIRDVWVIEQHEPILLVGIPESKLDEFADQYKGMNVADRIEVGSGENTVDAISGATVTVMVVNQSIMHAATKVAKEVGVMEQTVADITPHAIVKKDVFAPMDWTALTGDGSIRHLHLSRQQVDDSFKGTEAEHVDEAAPDEKQDTFTDLYYTYLNAPSIGKNLLGDSQYQWLMETLKDGEHAIAIMGSGIYSFKGSGYVRGGIFDRIKVGQGEIGINFRDLDYYRLSDIYAAGYPDFDEMAIYIVREHYDFDPGAMWDIELLVKRATGPLDSLFNAFKANYQIPEKYIDRPAPPVVEEPLPLWVKIWKDRMFQVVVVAVSLVLLMAIIFMQDWLVRYPKWLHGIRRAYLVYTLFYVGWYSLGQLSVVNVFTFTHALMGDFRWELFLMDPMIFMIWSFTAATILLWGRGVFCGWLCPFGALQELLNEIARKLKIRQFEVPFAVHERLWALKYIILLVLFGLSLQSVSMAEKAAEVEPFKTTIMLAFQREWWFVTYALTLIFVSIFTRKVYCRYICPLGAALAIPTKLRLFDWLKRRKECGQPCQLCAVECEIQAIHPDGTINANECHHCLDCQMTYHDQNKCPPLVNKAKKKKKRKPGPNEIPITEIQPA